MWYAAYAHMYTVYTQRPYLQYTYTSDAKYSRWQTNLSKHKASGIYRVGAIWAIGCDARSPLAVRPIDRDCRLNGSRNMERRNIRLVISKVVRPTCFCCCGSLAIVWSMERSADEQHGHISSLDIINSKTQLIQLQ